MIERIAADPDVRTATLCAMRLLRHLVPIVLLIGLLVASTGWYRSATAGGEQRFESCRIEAPTQTLVLKYFYGANQRVSVSLDTTRADVAVVGLHVRDGGGTTPAIGFKGEARFPLFGDPSLVRYEDGKELICHHE